MALDRIQNAAVAACDAMRRCLIPPTPRNFEVWFAYCTEDKPRLRQRTDRLIEAADPFTPGVMESLYQDFFVYPTGVAASDARQLRQIAAQLADRIAADREPIADYSSILRACSPILFGTPTPENWLQAATTLSVATSGVDSQMAALEQLFSASVLQINELQERLTRSEKDAACDALTGIANRRAFDIALLKATAQATANGTDVPLLLLDIDYFKKFNDLYGHSVGDNVLRLVAQVLTKHIKGRDTAARYGGEEFDVILEQADFRAAMTIAEQIRLLLEKSPLANRKTGQSLGAITCSIGVAIHRADEALGEFIDRTDKALYKAKQTGRIAFLATKSGSP